MIEKVVNGIVSCAHSLELQWPPLLMHVSYASQSRWHTH
jgi:hypothetical protein